MTPFKAFRVHTIDNKPVCRFEQLTLDDLDAGPVLIRTAYSAITYKDAMAARGVGRNVRISAAVRDGRRSLGRGGFIRGQPLPGR